MEHVQSMEIIIANDKIFVKYKNYFQYQRLYIAVFSVRCR